MCKSLFLVWGRWHINTLLTCWRYFLMNIYIQWMEAFSNNCSSIHSWAWSPYQSEECGSNWSSSRQAGTLLTVCSSHHVEWSQHEMCLLRVNTQKKRQSSRTSEWEAEWEATDMRELMETEQTLTLLLLNSWFHRKWSFSHLPYFGFSSSSMVWHRVAFGTQSCSRGYSIVWEPGIRLRVRLLSDSQPEEESGPQPPAFKERSPPERRADQSQRRTARLPTGWANQRGRAGVSTVPVNWCTK